MQRHFKCCKLKEFSNYCCIECSSIFHPSCLERLPQVVRLNGYRIFCSEECQKQASELENKEEAFKEEIETLQKELYQKDRYIERLKRNSKIYEEVALDAENNLTVKLENLNKKNTSLEAELKIYKNNENEIKSRLAFLNEANINLEEKIRELSDVKTSLTVSLETLDKENVEYFKEIKDLRHKLDNFSIGSAKEELEELQKTTECMLTSIRVLESEKHQYGCEIKSLQDEVDRLTALHITKTSKQTQHTTEVDQIPVDKANDVTLPSTQDNRGTKKMNKMLILCDEAGRGLRKALYESFNKDYQVQCIIKPGASFMEVVTNIEQLVKYYNKNDCVIVLAGSYEFERTKLPKVREIWQKIKYCTHTNLIFLPHPAVQKFVFSEKIYKFYNRFHFFIDKVNWVSEGAISFLNYFDSGRNKWGLIPEMILNSLNSNKGLVKNLLFVPLINSGQELEKASNEQENTTTLTNLLENPVQNINDAQSLSTDNNQSFLDSTMTIHLSP